MVIGTDYSSCILLCLENVEHFVRVRVAVERLALLVVVVLLVLVSRLMFVYHQTIGTLIPQGNTTHHSTRIVIGFICYRRDIIGPTNVIRY